MKYCAHFFIGKDFVELLSEMAVVLMADHRDALPYNYFYSLDISGGKDVIIPQELSHEDGCLQWKTLEDVNINEFSKYWSDNIFDHILDIQRASQGELPVFIHFPLYKQDALDVVKKMCQAINDSSRPVNVDFVGYGDDVHRILQPQSQEKLQPVSNLVGFLRDMYKQLNYTPQQNNLIVIQNKTMNGISILNKDAGRKPFSEMIANLSVLLASQYQSVVEPLSVDAREVVGLGFSSLSFNKYLFVDYLVQKIMMHAIDSHGINNNDVDVNKLSVKVEEILQDKNSIFSHFVETWKGRENSNPNYEEIVDAVQDIQTRIFAYFKRENDMTAKAAVLALLLSHVDCELFSSSFYSEERNSFEDLYSEAINHFITSDQIEYYHMPDDTVPENKIAELKQINQTLLQTENQKRDLKEQLENYTQQMERNAEVGMCCVEDGYFKYNDQKFRLLPNIEEEPLKETYVPHEIKCTSIDLRSKFSCIKSQGQQGSCLSFTLTSIFEYMMRVNLQEDCDLSEAFLYYNARNLDSTGDVDVNTDKGSRFHPSIESLSKYGIALEKFWPYNEDVYSTQPSEQAYKDAENRKLITALNVEHKVHDIKSALSDGYPVAASFVLYPSFGKNGAYIQLPTDEEIQEHESKDQKENNSHAMVIVGFSDILQMFLVRNSWGVDWGEGGYCYIPYEYIEHNKCFNFACAITEVASLRTDYQLQEVPELKINDSDIQIRFQIAQAHYNRLIQQEKNLRIQRDELLKYLELQKNLYIDTKKRDEFVARNVAALNEENVELKNQNEEHKGKQVQILADLKKKRIRTLIKVGVSIVIGVLVCLVVNWFAKLINSDMTFWSHLIVFAIVVIPWTIYVSIKYHQSWVDWRDERDSLDRLIKRNEKTISDNIRKRDQLRHKTFAAWKTIDALNKLQNQLGLIYANFINLINNLRTWYGELKVKNQELNFASSFPNIMLLNQSSLDKYFYDVLCKNIELCSVDFSKDIENHEISLDYLSEYKQDLVNELKDRLLIWLEKKVDYSVSSHAAEVPNKYQPLLQDVSDMMLGDWKQQAKIFLQINSHERPDITLNNVVLASNIQEIGQRLLVRLARLNLHNLVETDELYKMTLISTITLKFEECVMFQNQENKTKK